MFDLPTNIGDDQGTAAASVTHTAVPPATRTAATLLTEDASELRSRVRNLGVDTGQTYQLVVADEWSLLTQQRGTQNPIDLLQEMSECGFAWRDVARLIGVSVPAIQKWRKGERLSGENRRKLSGLLAAIDLLVSHFHVEEPASWFEMPIADNVPVTPIDLWAQGEYALFFDYGTGHSTSEETLTRFDPEWRERYRSNFKIFRGDDGYLGLQVQE